MENRVFNKCFPLKVPVERIYKFSGKHVVILVASKYYEMLTLRKHITSSLMQYFLNCNSLNLRLKKKSTQESNRLHSILEGIFIFSHYLPKPLPEYTSTPDT